MYAVTQLVESFNGSKRCGHYDLEQSLQSHRQFNASESIA
jgi:hypothetical protein